GRGLREQARIHATRSETVAHQATRNGKSPRQHRGARYERSTGPVHVQKRLLHQFLRSEGVPRGFMQEAQRPRRDLRVKLPEASLVARRVALHSRVGPAGIEVRHHRYSQKYGTGPRKFRLQERKSIRRFRAVTETFTPSI